MWRRQLLKMTGLSLVVLSCTVEEPPPPDDEVSGLGGTCESSSDCQGGLLCSVGSRIAGLCTTACMNTTECQVSFGDTATCVDGFCVRVCAFDPDCPGGACDESEGICVTMGACTDRGNGCEAGKPCCFPATNECKPTTMWGDACCWDPSRGTGSCARHSDCCAPAMCMGGNCCMGAGAPCSTVGVSCCSGSCLPTGFCL